MRAWWLALLLGLAGCGGETPPPQGQVVFHSSPEGAEVYLHGQDNPTGLHNPGVPDGQASFVGRAGVPLPLDLKPFRDKKQTIHITFRLEGHKETTIVVGSDFGSEKRGTKTEPQYWRAPSTGEAKLEPDNALVSARDLLIAYRWPMGLIAVSAAGLLAALIRQRAALRRAALREAKLKLLTHSDGTDPLVGRQLGNYLIASRLGSGGMAVVYRGLPFDTLDETQAVAIKVITPAAANDPDFLGRFRREVNAYRELSHPHIVRLMDWGDEDPIYLAMELVEGTTLRQHLGGEAISVERAVGLLLPMVSAVAYAHGRGIVHRDLKPDNVMLGKGNLVKVMDFGLARGRDVSRQITATGTALGTPDYMSPEQIQGATTPHADQYALGIIAYEMLAGRMPYEGDTMSILFAHITEDAPPLREFCPGVPPELEQLVMKMIERSEGDRFGSLDEVLAELKRLFPGHAR